MQTNPLAEGDTTHADQYLTFMLDAEEYGVDILRVQEIRGWTEVTPMPNMPEYIKGIIDLRGTIVPIVDLRQRFGMACLAQGPTTVVIVVRVPSSTQKYRTIGLVVDAVSEVYDIKPKDHRPKPDIGNISSDCVTGLGAVDGKMLILLDVERVVDLVTMQDAITSTNQPPTAS